MSTTTVASVTRQGTRCASRPNHVSGRAGHCRSRDRASAQVSGRDYGARVGGSRFLETDPIEGGSCNDYDYVCADPVGGLDLTGTRMCVDRDCHMSFAGKRPPNLRRSRYRARMFTVRSIYWTERAFHWQEVNERHRRYLGRMAPDIAHELPRPNVQLDVGTVIAVGKVIVKGVVGCAKGAVLGAGAGTYAGLYVGAPEVGAPLGAAVGCGVGAVYENVVPPGTTWTTPGG